MKKWLLLLLTSGMLVIAGCGESDDDVQEEEDKEEEVEEEETPEEDEAEEETPVSGDGEIDQALGEEALAILEQNLVYANEQDVDGYLEAVPAELQADTRDVIEQTFAQGQIDYEIIDYHVDSTSEDEIVISVLQTTIAAEPIEGFTDNIAEIQHTLRQEDGAWKIFETQIINNEPYGDDADGSEASAKPEQGEIDEAIAQEAVVVIEENLEYSNAADTEGYLKAIPEAHHEQTIAAMDQLFTEFDLEFGMEEIEVISATPEEAQIYVVQTTVSAEPREDFQDNIAEVLHTLRQENGEWKIYSTETISAEPYEAN